MEKKLLHTATKDQGAQIERERENTQEGTHRRIEPKNMNLSRTYAGLGEREEERRDRESVGEIFKEQKTG